MHGTANARDGEDALAPSAVLPTSLHAGHVRAAPDSWSDSPPTQLGGGPRPDPHEALFHSLPETGGQFLGFELVAELGRGTFGRVFLGRQSDLAGRLVALKISTEIVSESQKLAQLQHTHIVPI